MGRTNESDDGGFGGDQITTESSPRVIGKGTRGRTTVTLREIWVAIRSTFSFLYC